MAGMFTFDFYTIGQLSGFSNFLHTFRMGLCNGTRLIIEKMKDHVILAEVITGSAIGRHVVLFRIDNISSGENLPFKLKRRQFPIKPAFSMSITKSQGQTFKKIGVYLEEPVFSHGKTQINCSLLHFWIITALQC